MRQLPGIGSAWREPRLMADLPRIPLARPEVDEAEIAEIREVFASGYLTQGPKVAEFERMVAERVGTRYAFAMSSATTALHLALAALEIGPGDEVLVPDFTFPATANVVVQQGAVPVLVDIDLETFTIDIDDLANKITPRSKVVMPVDAFGLAADMARVNAAAGEHGLAVIEDAACAIGTTYYEQRCGGLGALGCFSFHPRKVITTGEGGMIMTDDDRLAERIRLLRSHGGIRRNGRFSFEAAGYNYRLSDVQGAIGIAQMRKLDAMLAQRRSLAALYDARLTALPGVRPPCIPDWGGHIYQAYVVLLDDRIDRDAVIASMASDGVETTLGTYALHREPFFMRTLGCKEGDLPSSARAYRQTLCLPLYPRMTPQDIERVAGSLQAAL